jgi:Co/Zn/Cd efflux system component
MADCCSNTACEIDKLRGRQSWTLKIVLAINGVMFLVEFSAGILAASTALMADSLDMLGDTIVYGFSLYVVSRNDAWKAVSAMIKGGIMALFGFFVLAQAAVRVFNPVTPQFEWIGLIGLLALVTNALCLSLLWHHRTDDVNMRSVWLCSRNDIIANTSVLFAALGVWILNSQWPDLLVGLGIAGLFLRSAIHVFRDAIVTYRAHNKSSNRM